MTPQHHQVSLVIPSTAGLQQHYILNWTVKSSWLKIAGNSTQIPCALLGKAPFPPDPNFWSKLLEKNRSQRIYPKQIGEVMMVISSCIYILFYFSFLFFLYICCNLPFLLWSFPLLLSCLFLSWLGHKFKSFFVIYYLIYCIYLCNILYVDFFAVNLSSNELSFQISTFHWQSFSYQNLFCQGWVTNARDQT